jgi:hypothetical protein
MKEREPNLIYSSLSGVFGKDGVTVEVNIVRLELETKWTLEVVNTATTSFVWDETFATDEEAYEEFRRAVEEEGMQAFVENSNVVPFRR